MDISLLSGKYFERDSYHSVIQQNLHVPATVKLYRDDNLPGLNKKILNSFHAAKNINEEDICIVAKGRIKDIKLDQHENTPVSKFYHAQIPQKSLLDKQTWPLGYFFQRFAGMFACFCWCRVILLMFMIIQAI